MTLIEKIKLSNQLDAEIKETFLGIVKTRAAHSTLGISTQLTTHYRQKNVSIETMKYLLMDWNKKGLIN